MTPPPPGMALDRPPPTEENRGDVGARGSSELSRLRWVAIAGPPIVVGLLELVAWQFAPGLTRWPGRLALAVVAATAFVALIMAVCRRVESTQTELSRRNRELLALHRASLDIYGELSLEVILQKVVDQIRVLVGAHYGAVSVIGRGKKIEEFVTSGIDSAQSAAIGSPPSGDGLLGIPLRQGQTLRLDDLTSHPSAVGFPAHHPPMKSLLAVPINCKGSFRGNLYLANKHDERSFTEEDQATVTRFADQVAIAIDNADVHRQLSSLVVTEERARIAREMHDGMAQVLAYTNTKAQVVREHLLHDRPGEAANHLEQLSAAAREAYRDAREGILALRTTQGSDESLAAVLRRYAERWQEQTSMSVELEAESGIEVPGAVELQLLRIVQEALSNARKHSGAGRARVELRRDGGRVIASVADDGHGFDPRAVARRQGPRFGLSIMRERAESVGGSLSIDSLPDEGTRVTVSVPLPQ